MPLQMVSCKQAELLNMGDQTLPPRANLGYANSRSNLPQTWLLPLPLQLCQQGSRAVSETAIPQLCPSRQCPLGD